MGKAAIRILLMPCVASVFLQTTAATQSSRREFEVASVKANKSDDFENHRVDIGPGERVTFVNMPLIQIILTAFEKMPFEIEGGPGWIRSERFDVIAKAPRPAPARELNEMLRTLLEERFKLATHAETRPVTVYGLVQASRTEKLGPRLRRASIDCATLRLTAQTTRQPPCRIMRVGVRGGRGLPLDDLAKMLRSEVQDRVIDKTGLVGNFDWDLEYTPPMFLARGFDHERFPTISPDGPSLTTALKEQLNLNLVRDKGTADVLVIDSIARPAAEH